MIRILAICALLVCGFAGRLQGQANDELVDTVIGFLKDSDKEIRAIAFEQIRAEVKGPEATKQFAAQIPNLDRDGQLGLIRALGDRGDAAAKPVVAQLIAEAQDNAVRVAAIGTLGKIGDTSDCATLVQLLSGQTDVTAAARQALVTLQGTQLSQQIVNQIETVPVASQVALIEILTERRAKDSTAELLRLAAGTNPTLRSAAMKALGQMADPEHVPALADAVLIATPGNERNDAERNLMRVCNRIEDKEQRAEPLLAAMRRLDASQQAALLPALGRIGGRSALDEISQAIISDDKTAHEAGIRGISNWPDASVAKMLIVIAEQDPHVDHRRIARLSLLRVAPLPDGRADSEKLDLLKTGMELAANDAERNYGLKRAAPIRTVETLRFIVPYMEKPPFAKQACQSIVELAHDRQLRDDNKSEFHAALDRVIATTTDPVLIDRANRYKKGQTWVRPK